MPDWTFTATAEVVRYLGADPVIVDVDPATLCLDYAAAEKAVTARTKAVMPVHLAGLAVDWLATAEFARRHRLAVVEDAAHSLPTYSRGRLVGDVGDVGDDLGDVGDVGDDLGDGGARRPHAVVFSFYATKTMTTGEGGMVVVADEAMAQRIRTMRLHGISRDVFDRYRSTAPSWFYEVVEAGYKYNLTDPAAAMGRVQLRRQPRMFATRQALARRYRAAFAGPFASIRPGSPGFPYFYRILFVLGLVVAVPLFLTQLRRRLFPALFTVLVAVWIVWAPVSLLWTSDRAAGQREVLAGTSRPWAPGPGW